jgi:hypothetical protein
MRFGRSLAKFAHYVADAPKRRAIRARRSKRSARALISLGKAQQFALGIGEMARAGTVPQPSRQFPIMRPGIRQPPIPVRGDVLQCGRVFI